VYATCLFCKGPLGRNEAIENFQVGRRLAYEATRGRLWVVCGRCERWNLTPLESRWEAIEEAERAYRGSRLRVSTDNIGLARLPEGLELVRVGKSPRLELATWRYGDQFGRRRRKYIALSSLGVAIPLLYWIPVAGPFALVPGLISTAHSFNTIRLARLAGRVPRVVVRDDEGAALALTAKDIFSTQLSRDQSEHGWSITVEHKEKPLQGSVPRTRKAILRGAEAERALTSLLPHINSNGGSGRRVRQALDLIGTTTDARELVQSAALLQTNKVAPNYLQALPAPMRLALEMALHEDDERRAMEGELSRLENQWREAEEIATIADSLLVPDEIESQLSALRERLRMGEH
jgi:hypothetical protein